MNPDFYEILGIGKDATEDEITHAYHSLARKYHPDSPSTGDTEKFKQVEEAYRCLKDAQSRKHYDVFGKAASQRSDIEIALGGLVAGAFNDRNSKNPIRSILKNIDHQRSDVRRGVENLKGDLKFLNERRQLLIDANKDSPESAHRSISFMVAVIDETMAIIQRSIENGEKEIIKLTEMSAYFNDVKYSDSPNGETPMQTYLRRNRSPMLGHWVGDMDNG